MQLQKLYHRVLVGAVYTDDYLSGRLYFNLQFVKLHTNIENMTKQISCHSL